MLTTALIDFSSRKFDTSPNASLMPLLTTKFTELDRNGNQDSLRFPSFHEEVLHHPHWDAGETYGRIRVVIAEGFTRPHRSPPFERVRDVIIFSYQHAPLRKLYHQESVGIFANDAA